MNDRVMSSPTADELRATMLELLAARDASSSICPSEVARACGDDGWRELMDPVREVAKQLAERGEIIVTQGDETVDIARARGPIRLRRGPKWRD